MKMEIKGLAPVLPVKYTGMLAKHAPLNKAIASFTRKTLCVFVVFVEMVARAASASRTLL
jgi:hypothetical protein